MLIWFLLHQVWMWSKAKFINRKFLMEEMYQQHQAEQSEENVGDTAGTTVSLYLLYHVVFCSVSPHFTFQKSKGFPAVTFSRDQDPFWDPVEPLLLGTAHLWLQTLAFRIPLEEQLEVCEKDF